MVLDSAPMWRRDRERHWARWVRVAVLAAWVVSAAACVRGRPAAGPTLDAGAFSLALAGEYILPREARVANEPQAIGGISGLTQDVTPGVILGVSDARDLTRAYQFSVEGEGASFRVRPTGLIPLGGRSADGIREPEPPIVDLEAIARTPEDRLMVASEGDGDRSPRLPTVVLSYDREGRFLGSCPLPPAFVSTPSGPITSGTRRNAGFESLAIAPGGQVMFVGAESPLAQDDEPATLEQGARTRIVEYRRDAGAGGSCVPGRQFVYMLDPVAGGDFTPTFFINGLVELLAWNDHELLALERSYAEGAGGRRRNRIRVYQVSLAGADDVSGWSSLREAGHVTPVTKRLVLDLDDVRGLSPRLSGLDNFEGMTFGPRLSDGSDSLMLVSDDNFSATQQTAFLLFRIVRRRWQ